jgi:hypothetical protein
MGNARHKSANPRPMGGVRIHLPTRNLALVVRYLDSLGAVHGRVFGKCTFQTLPHGTAGALTKQPLLL